MSSDMADVRESKTIQLANKEDKPMGRIRVETKKPGGYRNTGANDVQKYASSTRILLFSRYGYPQAHERNQVLPFRIVRKRSRGHERRKKGREQDKENGEDLRFTMFNPVYDL